MQMRVMVGTVLLQVLLATDQAQYLCSKPAAAYKKTFSHLAEQVQIAFQVFWGMPINRQSLVNSSRLQFLTSQEMMARIVNLQQSSSMFATVLAFSIAGLPRFASKIWRKARCRAWRNLCQIIQGASKSVVLVTRLLVKTLFLRPEVLTTDSLS